MSQAVTTGYDAGKRTVSVTTSDGYTMIFKSVPTDDVPALQHFLEFARANPPAEPLASAAVPDGGSALLSKETLKLEAKRRSDLHRAETVAAREEKTERRVAATTARAAEQDARRAADEQAKSLEREERRAAASRRRAEAEAEATRVRTQKEIENGERLATRESAHAARAQERAKREAERAVQLNAREAAREAQERANAKEKAAKQAASAEMRAAKQARQAEKRADLETRRAASQAAFEEARQEAGARVASGSVGSKSVEIYTNGYVRVSNFITKGTPYRRLLGIESSADVTKKSGLGRAVGALASGGLNLMSSNIRGDVYLTIVTPNKTHQIHVESPSPSTMKAVNALVGAGKVVLGSIARSAATPPATPEPSCPSAPGVAARTASERLRELAALHEQGLVTESELAAKRAAILDGL
ncbi:hypothetical protein GCM10023221_27480 [Luteimicrobium xylanilyticum]|uniref:Protein anoxia up-regulated n=1 Tax=Luteimicrobium xylanilyticum TaxID=1133546 RepID=A0A5P9QAR7_9MICO|nr:hypothetical protein [Luteimicrobium xylanilyticum]QFU98533.1 Protein anoxia up-regulated [Luteimicrobium xylanilyticum]